MKLQAKLFIAATAALGILLFVHSVLPWQSQDYLRLSAYLLIALLASGLKVVLPGINTTVSVNFLFILLGILELSLPETMVLGCASTLAQCFWKMNRPARPVRVLFNVFSMMAPAIWMCAWVYGHSGVLLSHSLPLQALAAACTFFLANTLPVAAIINLTEGMPFRKTWSECYLWAFPYYLAGAGLITVVHYLNRYLGWQTALLILPIVYWVYRSYRLYLSRLADEKRHVEDMAALHLRTIEALALAIEAKDHTTHDHLQRVRMYAVEVGRELGLSEAELEALKAAALLHDIGKLAVPEHIINKPGRLTPEEFDKMKIHPAVGAEILERVQFPYPVVPMVRAHHEKLDGSGYPDALRGEDIPIGARILAAVDCLDAMASDRQYRRAIPLDKAMEHVAGLAGKEFDTRVVEILKRRYIELEKMAQAHSSTQDFSFDRGKKLPRAVTPAAGLQQEPQARAGTEYDFLSSIAAARQEAQVLFELTHDLGNSLSLEDTLSVVSARLRKLVPYDSITIWMREGETVVPRYASGDDFRLFSSLQIPLGQGVSGWAAQNAKPVLNGNPSLEPAYLKDAGRVSRLRSALSVPLEGLSGIIGALTLYRAEPEGFTKDHLRILLAVSSKLALSIENALKFQQAQTSASTDFLTGLPNARSLFLYLDRELARCKRTGSTLAVMVCDLDNFKSINDRLGHLEGNRVLRVFASALQENCREYDYVARMGGDEFVIIASGLTPEAAQHKAERINSLTRNVGLQVFGEDTLSASIGTAFFLTDGTDVEQLLAEADKRMYMVKEMYNQKREADRQIRAAQSAASLMN
jgi:diguanylate cyclase (GGDEF)-like protein/putative nucleotidyltransferase with HDIG domain